MGGTGYMAASPQERAKLSKLLPWARDPIQQGTVPLPTRGLSQREPHVLQDQKGPNPLTRTNPPGLQLRDYTCQG